MDPRTCIAFVKSVPETGTGTSVRDQGIKRLGNYELINKMNKLQLVPPSPPKTKNGKLVWQKEEITLTGRVGIQRINEAKLVCKRS